MALGERVPPTGDSTRRARRALLALTFVALVSLITAAASRENPIILLFFEEGCPSCETIDALIVELASDLPLSSIARYEISDADRFELLTRLAAAFEIEFDSVPVVFVGDEAIVGAGRSAEFGLRAAIGDCVVRGCPSPLDRVRPPAFPWFDLVRLAALGGLVVLLAALQPL